MKRINLVTLRAVLVHVRLLLLYGIFCLGTAYATLAVPWPATSLAAPSPTPVSAPLSLGITVDWAGLAPNLRHNDIQRLQNAGFDWVRIRIDWAEIEPAPDSFNWRYPDAVLADLSQTDLDVVVVLDGSPPWARMLSDLVPHDNPYAPPASPDTFAAFARAFARRYADDVRYYQIWDEPNIAPHWGNRHIEPVAYAHLLHRAAQAIRSVDSNAYILTAALAPTVDRGHTAIDEIYFLQRLYAANAHRSWDAVAIQPLGFGDSPVGDRPHRRRLNFQRAKLIHQTMLAAGDSTTPIWAIRFGWNTRYDSPWGTVTAMKQLGYAHLALALARIEWPWMAAAGWAIDRPLATLDNPIWGYALHPQLSATLTGVMAQPELPGHSSGPRPAHAQLQWLLGLYVVGTIVGGWRIHSALGQITWSDAIRRLESMPDRLYWLSWISLGVIYYLATWPPLVLACALVAIWLMQARPSAGLWLIVLCLPYYYQHKAIEIGQLEWLVPPAHLLSLCLLVATLGTICQSKGNFSRLAERWLLLALAWIAITLLSITNVLHWSGYTTGTIDLVLMPVLIFVLVRTHCQSEKDLYSIAMAAIASGVTVAVLGLTSWSIGAGTEADGMRRLVGPHFSPNHTALFLLRCLILAVGLAALSHKLYVRRHAVVSVLILAPALLLTGSRGALLLGLPAGLLYLLLARRFSLRTELTESWNMMLRGRRTLSLLAWAVATALVVGLVLTLMGDRLVNSATVQARFDIWRHSLSLWRDYSLFGVGPGGFFWRFPAYIPPDSALDANLRHPHNLFVEYATMWGTAGLIWLSAAAALFINYWLRGHAYWRPVTVATAAALLAGIAHGQVDAFATLPDIAAWNWLALAIMTHPAAVAQGQGNLPEKKCRLVVRRQNHQSST